MQSIGWALIVFAPLVLIYTSKIPTAWVIAAVAVGAVLAIGGAVAYLAARKPAKQLVWPAPHEMAEAKAA